MRVYVAAPYIDAPLVRDVHGRMLALGIAPSSSWATAARGDESFDEDVKRRAIVQNDNDVASSDAMLVLARDGAGGEMFCEARYALVLGQPIYWVGRRILSAWRDGVTRCADLDEALVVLAARKEFGSDERNRAKAGR